mgnify:CR=1 FL=1|jgi:predicted dehydrogenase|tara:strand:- start:3221 stop:4132 length:912 start_codon:yes stop_codon:yes gene_type:complete
MKIAIIGYRNHALRLRALLNKLGYENIINYNYHKHSIQTLSEADIFFIATPNASHVDWVKRLEDYNKYIFCEKPPATNEKDLEDIHEYREKLYFNFNYRFSLLAKVVKKYNRNGELGSPIYINCLSTHGLAFKKAFQNNWRFRDGSVFSSVVGNVGVHYVDLLTYLFGPSTDLTIKYLPVASKELPDTCKITVAMNRCFADVFLSYASPFTNRITVIYDDGIVELANGELSVREPRDSYDKDGYFISPNKKIIGEFRNARHYYDDALTESIKYFLACVNNNIAIPVEHYRQSIESNRLLLKKG